MKTALVVAALALALLGTPCAQGAKPLNALDRVQRVEILYFPEWIQSQGALSPERLEQFYEYKLEIREVRESREWQKLSSALRETSLEPSKRNYDHRIAVLLYDQDGQRIFSVYFDQLGKGGTLNGDSGTIKGGLYRWSKSMLRTVGE